MTVNVVKTQGWYARYEQPAIRLTWELHNLSAQPITAFQMLVSVNVADKLGRKSDLTLNFACTDNPLAAGEVRTGHPTGAKGSEYATIEELDAVIADSHGCTAAAWDLNRYMEDQMYAQQALVEGAVPVVEAEVVRVVFADGTALGEPVQ
ncbi:hypothetical protein BH10ACT1_BH10ACT1_28400 [soil metagenome]